MIIFIGSEPGKKNVNLKVPFVGTKSYKRLLEWIYLMNIDISEVYTMNASDITWSRPEFDEIGDHRLTCEYDAIVALGGNVHKKLRKLGHEHYKLHHPSGLCRINNDKAAVEAALKAAKAYIDEKRSKK